MQEHNKEQDSQPSEVLPQSEGVPPPPNPSPERPLWLTTTASRKQSRKTPYWLSPFTVLEAFADLERDDPKLAFQASRLVGIYRRLWESCVAKHRDCEKTIETNQRLSRLACN
ncbi:hypothetical protein N7451_012807 [Penicillium sp. IBT 35674x]|nr:hypothetical protein N7451_012807 [Penicillium sp. IBT 35674x]